MARPATTIRVVIKKIPPFLLNIKVHPLIYARGRAFVKWHGALLQGKQDSRTGGSKVLNSEITHDIGMFIFRSVATGVFDIPNSGIFEINPDLANRKDTKKQWIYNIYME
jgi:hypothetical protein